MLRVLAVGWLALAAMAAAAFADDIEINAQLAACEQGSAAVCFAAAAQLRQQHIASRLGRTPVALVARGMAILDEQCAAGSGDACFTQARQLQRAGADGAVKVKRGCELGSGDACLYLASTEHDSAAAFADLSRACDVRAQAHAPAADMAVCDRAGGLATDAAAARALFQHACDGDDALGCVHLGERIARGEGGERDWGAGCRLRGDRAQSFAEALPLYRKGCALRDPAACGYVRFERARHGSSVDIRTSRADCSHDSAACALFGLAIARSDRAQVTAVWTAACDAKVGVACRFLAESATGRAEEGGAFAELILPPHGFVGGTCDCDDGSPRRRREAEFADAQRHQDDAWRFYGLGCEAGDARSCEGTSGSGHYYDKPPGRVVELPAWE